MMNKIIFPRPTSSYTEESILDSTRNMSIKWIQRRRQLDPPNSGNRNEQPSSMIPVLVSIYKDKDYSKDSYLLFFHSNAEDLGNVTRLVDEIKRTLQLNVIAMEYPTYGVSTDRKMSVDQLKSDAHDVYKFMTESLLIPKEKIIVMGRSIGTGLALDLCAKEQPHTIILISPFTSIKDLVSDRLRILRRFVEERFDNFQIAPNINSNCFLIHGREDLTINFSHSERLLTQLQHVRSELFLTNATHSRFSYSKDLLLPTKKFLRDSDFSTDLIPFNQLNEFFRNDPQFEQVTNQITQEQIRSSQNQFYFAESQRSATITSSLGTYSYPESGFGDSEENIDPRNIFGQSLLRIGRGQSINSNTNSTRQQNSENKFGLQPALASPNINANPNSDLNSNPNNPITNTASKEISSDNVEIENDTIRNKKDNKKEPESQENQINKNEKSNVLQKNARFEPGVIADLIFTNKKS